jgi:hypothetical protein
MTMQMTRPQSARDTLRAVNESCDDHEPSHIDRLQLWARDIRPVVLRVTCSRCVLFNTYLVYLIFEQVTRKREVRHRDNAVFTSNNSTLFLQPIV